MPAREFRFDDRQQGGDHGVRDVGERRPRGLRVDDVAQHLHADLELALVGPAPGDVEHVPKVARLFQCLLERRGQDRGIGRRIEKSGLQDGVEGRGIAA